MAVRGSLRVDRESRLKSVSSIKLRERSLGAAPADLTELRQRLPALGRAFRLR